MQVDFRAAITNLTNEPMKDGEGKEFTLGACVANAALSALPGDDKATGEEKAKRYKLARLAMSGGTKELSAEQLATAKDVVGRAYATIIVGSAYDLLDGVPAAPQDALLRGAA